MGMYKLTLVRDCVDRCGIPERRVLRVSPTAYSSRLEADQECDYRNYDLDEHIYWIVVMEGMSHGAV